MILISVYSDVPRIYGENLLFLYKLLSQRKPHQNISHRSLPSFEQHKEFVDRKPYKEWLIVYHNGPIGAVYITEQDEIGLFILDEYQDKGYGSDILNLLYNYIPRKTYYANISPNNYKSINFFKKNGYVWHKNLSVNNLDIHQVTYIKT